MPWTVDALLGQAAEISGCSIRHGTHQEANTLTSIGLPPRSARLNPCSSRPSSGGRLKSGAGLPTRADGSVLGIAGEADRQKDADHQRRQRQRDAEQEPPAPSRPGCAALRSRSGAPPSAALAGSRAGRGAPTRRRRSVSEISPASAMIAAPPQIHSTSGL